VAGEFATHSSEAATRREFNEAVYGLYRVQIGCVELNRFWWIGLLLPGERCGLDDGQVAAAEFIGQSRFRREHEDRLVPLSIGYHVPGKHNRQVLGFSLHSMAIDQAAIRRFDFATFDNFLQLEIGGLLREFAYLLGGEMLAGFRFGPERHVHLRNQFPAIEESKDGKSFLLGNTVPSPVIKKLTLAIGCAVTEQEKSWGRFAGQVLQHRRCQMGTATTELARCLNLGHQMQGRGDGASLPLLGFVASAIASTVQKSGRIPALPERC
jgi:hypothetical protein